MSATTKLNTLFDFMAVASIDLSKGLQFQSQDVFVSWATENFEEIVQEALVRFSSVKLADQDIFPANKRKFIKPCPRKLDQLVSQLAITASDYHL